MRHIRKLSRHDASHLPACGVNDACPTLEGGRGLREARLVGKWKTDIQTHKLLSLPFHMARQKDKETGL